MYHTSYLEEASCLVYCGFQIDRIEVTRDGRNPKCLMLFDTSDELLQAVNKFWNSELGVEPRSYQQIRMQLLDRIKAALKQDELTQAAH